MSDKGPASPPRRRSTAAWMGRAIIATLCIAFSSAALAFYFTPVWLPQLPRSNSTSLDLDRFSRLLRYVAGVSMPGEPDLDRLPQRLAEAGVKQGAPIFVRIFKREFELELWMKSGDTFRLFATYPICMWSGDLGPKLKQGDGQAPEGFYTVDAAALNPNSKYHRSFNLGYPNAFDKAQGRTGSLIMVHGSCVSIGCFAMTNAQVDEIWQLTTAALGNGQQRFQVQVFPFRMTDANVARASNSSDIGFWRNLKVGHDLFAANSIPPKISVCRGAYAFEAGAKGGRGDATIGDGCPPAGTAR